MNNLKSEKLHRIAASFIIGENIEAEIDGKGPQITTLRSLLEVSKKLKEQLDDPTSNLDDELETLEEKKEITKRFQNLTGIEWRL